MVLIFDHGRTGGIDCSLPQQFRREVHKPPIVGVSLIKLKHGELGIMADGYAFDAEVAVDFVDAVDAADHEPLQVQFRCDAQVEIDIERVVMRDEGPRGRAAVEGLHHRRFDFDESFLLQLAP